MMCIITMKSLQCFTSHYQHLEDSDGRRPALQGQAVSSKHVDYDILFLYIKFHCSKQFMYFIFCGLNFGHGTFVLGQVMF